MTVSSYLEEDHRRIEDILQRATASNHLIDLKLFGEFRGALLRHIGMEERLLFPAIRNATPGSLQPQLDQLHLDHGALAALLVLTPTASIVDAIRAILSRHNVLEEGPEGIYHKFEDTPGIDAAGILTRLKAAPLVALNPHVDNATALESMHAAVRRAGYSLDI